LVGIGGDSMRGAFWDTVRSRGPPSRSPIGECSRERAVAAPPGVALPAVVEGQFCDGVYWWTTWLECDRDAVSLEANGSRNRRGFADRAVVALTPVLSCGCSPWDVVINGAWRRPSNA
jgi:hypothetical protein